MKHRSFLAALCALAVMLSLALPALAADSPFTDVNPEDYFYGSVLWAYESGITAGTGGDLFSPNRPCTRGQIVTFLWRAQGEPEPESTDLPFTDVPRDAYYCKAVLWAVENGITSGTGAGRFSPDAKCSRSQVATFLWRLAGCPQPSAQECPFFDIVRGDFYYDAVLWAVEQDITAGTGNNSFSPQANCSRAQIVTFLFRALADNG